MSACRWASMAAHLRGHPAPALPQLPGRVHQLATEADNFTPDDRESLLLSDLTDREIGVLLGVSRQRAHQLRQALRQRLATTEEPTT